MPALLIITGTTRGLGAALAQLAVARGHRVVGLSRRVAPPGRSVVVDLADCAALPDALDTALDGESLADCERIVLVNNAAVLGPIGPGYSPDDVLHHLHTNLAAPIILSRAFVDRLAEIDRPKRIVNLSSGAATRPFDGWSLYCASKAGLDHFGRCLALETARARHPFDLLGISPGVIDTGMQADIRAAAYADFPDVDRFHALQAEGALADPKRVADVVLRAALSDAIHGGAVRSLAELA